MSVPDTSFALWLKWFVLWPAYDLRCGVCHLRYRYEELLIALSKQKANMMDPQLDPVCYSNVDNVIERQQKEELQVNGASQHV